MSIGAHSWHEVALGDVCEFKYGKSLPEDQRCLGDCEVFGSNGVVGSHEKTITDGPTIVIGRKGSFGEVHFSPKSCWPIDTTYYVDRSCTKEDLRWLTYRLSGLGLTKINRSKTIPGLNREDAYRLRLLLPPPSEQRRIADVLDRAEALRAKRRAALAQLDTLTQSIFLDLFGHPAANPRGWPKVSIESVAGIIVPTRDKPKCFRGTIPWVTLPDLDGLFISGAKNLLTVEDAEEVGNRLIPSNSVLLSCAGTLGKIAITTTQVYANQQFYGLVPHGDKLDATFFALCLLLRGETFFARLGGSFTIGFFSKQKALDIQIPLPSLSLQREFAGRVTALEKLKSAYRASLAGLDALFGVVQHRAFRGDL